MFDSQRAVPESYIPPAPAAHRALVAAPVTVLGNALRRLAIAARVVPEDVCAPGTSPTADPHGVARALRELDQREALGAKPNLAVAGRLITALRSLHAQLSAAGVEPGTELAREIAAARDTLTWFSGFGPQPRHQQALVQALYGLAGGPADPEERHATFERLQRLHLMQLARIWPWRHAAPAIEPLDAKGLIHALRAHEAYPKHSALARGLAIRTYFNEAVWLAYGNLVKDSHYETWLQNMKPRLSSCGADCFNCAEWPGVKQRSAHPCVRTLS